MQNIDPYLYKPTLRNYPPALPSLHVPSGNVFASLIHQRSLISHMSHVRCTSTSNTINIQLGWWVFMMPWLSSVVIPSSKLWERCRFATLDCAEGSIVVWYSIRGRGESAAWWVVLWCNNFRRPLFRRINNEGGVARATALNLHQHMQVGKCCQY